MTGSQDVAAAHARIEGHVRATPAMALAPGAFGLACSLAIKLESTQVSGSFKGRGAFHKLLLRPPGAVGVVAASGGNHGAAVAFAARALGHRAEIFVPTTSPAAKVDRLRGYGAIVHRVGAVYAEARAACDRRAAETGAMGVAAYDDPEVFVAAGTTALEFERQTPFDTLLVAVGGGGLIAGCALWCGDRVRIVAVETTGTATLNAALAAGAPVDVPISGLAADALGASRIGTPNFEIARRLVHASVLVDDEDVRRAQRALWSELRVIAEPAGATGLAALLSGTYGPSAGERVGIIVCGANTDPASMSG